MTITRATTKAELSSLNTTGGTNALALPDADVSRSRTRAAGLNGVDTRWGNASGPSKRGDLPWLANRTYPVATPYPLRTENPVSTMHRLSAARSKLDDLNSRANLVRRVIKPFNRGRTLRLMLPLAALSAPRISVADLRRFATLCDIVSDPHKDGDQGKSVYPRGLVPIPHDASDLVLDDSRVGVVAGPFTVADRAKGATRYSSVGNPSLAGDHPWLVALMTPVPGTTNPASDQPHVVTLPANVACPF